MALPVEALQAASVVLAPLANAITDWLKGEAEEPPQLVHLGIPEVELAEMRQRAEAARRLK